MKLRLAIPAALLLAALGNTSMAANIGTDDITPEHGRYVVQLDSCNSCHTAYSPEAGGKVSEKSWLAGNTGGYQTTGGAVNAGAAKGKRRG